MPSTNTLTQSDDRAAHHAELVAAHPCLGMKDCEGFDLDDPKRRAKSGDRMTGEPCDNCQYVAFMCDAYNAALRSL